MAKSPTTPNDATGTVPFQYNAELLLSMILAVLTLNVLVA